RPRASGPARRHAGPGDLRLAHGRARARRRRHADRGRVPRLRAPGGSVGAARAGAEDQHQEGPDLYRLGPAAAPARAARLCGGGRAPSPPAPRSAAGRPRRARARRLGGRGDAGARGARALCRGAGGGTLRVGQGMAAAARARPRPRARRSARSRPCSRCHPKRADVRPNFVANDVVLTSLAVRPVETMEDLRHVRGLTSGAVDRHGRAILAALRAGLECPAESWPERAPRLRSRTPAPGLAALLRAAVQAVAEREDIAPEVIASGREIEALASRGEAQDGLAVTRGWRRHLVGDTLLAIARGELAIAYDPERREVVTRGTK